MKDKIAVSRGSVVLYLHVLLFSGKDEEAFELRKANSASTDSGNLNVKVL